MTSIGNTSAQAEKEGKTKTNETPEFVVYIALRAQSENPENIVHNLLIEKKRLVAALDLPNSRSGSESSTPEPADESMQP
jgi:hypothetical protein